MSTITAVEFSRAARTLAAAARHGGWEPPTFLSPPRVRDAQRTVRRRSPGSAVVAVRIRDRPWSAVLGDLVEGVVVANRLEGAEADRCRDALWAAVAEPEARAA
ncbi:MAG: hypothetical protein GEV08_04795 [Acidimicrobiia bacterium]|nr:hypothetical protein [Acidimicrobiia bacterium]